MKVKIHTLFQYLLETTEAAPEAVVGFSLSQSPRLGEYLLINEDTRIGPSLQVLLVPGHAPGQLALMMDLPETGPVLIVSDAISRPAEIDEKFAGSWDEGVAIASGARLMDLADQTGAFVIYGHSPEQWPKLKKTPEFYD